MTAIKTPGKRGAPMERFMRHVQVEGDCLVWTSTYAGTKSRHGTFWPGLGDGRRKVYAHRWIYEQLVGPIPEDMELDHRRDLGCRGPGCVKPAHLEPVTPDENSRRARLSMCRAGKHDLSDPMNVNWDRQGRRRGCKVCNQEKALAHYYANHEKNRVAARERMRAKRDGEST
jgi:hypothetical protein